jgi:hypothetical protein
VDGEGVEGEGLERRLEDELEFGRVRGVLQALLRAGGRGRGQHRAWDGPACAAHGPRELPAALCG